MDNVKFRKHCSPEKNKLYADFYEVEATYDREKLSTMLILPFSTYLLLGTAVDVHRNDLFVNRLSATDHDDNALAKANESTKIDCVPPNTSIHGPLQIHDSP
ncbi:uncharacterized protein OCT59_027171 [Rhizophagus irregularis]|uniref:uncharacterized protein n=1 Tax=Rhizophagus irregularis TaxID=588596 RepID=UPI003320E8D9|nr:hypothetical protein OCT59_027171 [Rhizophagus irregularis]